MGPGLVVVEGEHENELLDMQVTLTCTRTFGTLCVQYLRVFCSLVHVVLVLVLVHVDLRVHVNLNHMKIEHRTFLKMTNSTSTRVLHVSVLYRYKWPV